MLRSERETRGPAPGVPAATLTLDEWGRIDGLSQEAAGLLGKRAADLLGVPLPGLFSGEDQARVEDLLRRARAGQAPGPAEALVAGTRRVRVAAQPLIGARPGAGTALAVVLSSAPAAPRPREAAPGEDLREAVRAREEFLSIAAHELRGPLTPLQLQLQLAMRLARTAFVSGDCAAAATQLGDQLAACERHVRRLARLIQSLLEVSRIAAGRMELVPEPLDLAQVARDVVTRFAPEAELVGTQVDLEAVACPGQWDRLRLEQVIGNLLGNAIKYGGGLPVRVEVGHLPGECPPGAPAGRRARIVVTDQGEGIAPEQMPRLFERFERGPATQKVGGLGLGLYIVKQIVDAMGGEITVQSRVGPGGGSRFTVDLPCGPNERLEPQPKSWKDQGS